MTKASSADNLLAKLKSCDKRSFTSGIVLLIVCLLGPSLAMNQQRGDVTAKRAVAITIDDVPYVGGPQHIEEVRRVTEELLQVVRSRAVPVSGFVTGTHVVVDGQVDERIALLRQWRDSGVDLEGHSHSHLSFNDLGLQNYTDDVVRGLMFPEKIMREREKTVRFYRHPFNHTGTTEQSKRAFENFLSARGIRLAPFTVEHADYLFNTVYVDARARGDLRFAERVADAYLTQLDVAFRFAEKIARENFGREIPHVFLIHANPINAQFFGAILGRLKERDYRFISLDEAMQDPAYATPDKYIGRTGISWLHRWREALGLPNSFREEPDPPKWVLDAYEKLRQ